MEDPRHAFVRLASELLELEGPVFEVKSTGTAGDINYRDVFEGKTYVCCDLQGAAASHAAQDLGELLPVAEQARTLLCTADLRLFHKPHLLVGQLLAVLGPGGTLVFAADLDAPADSGPPRGLTPIVLERAIAPLHVALVGWQSVDHVPRTLYAVACKEPLDIAVPRVAGRLVREFQQWIRESRPATHLMARVARWIVTRVRGTRPTAVWTTPQFALQWTGSDRWQDGLIDAPAPAPHSLLRSPRLDPLD